MSLSASDNNGSYSRVPSGKTPPPAPSAAFAKRAREIQAEERLARYRPPALRGMAPSGSPPNDLTATMASPVDAAGISPSNLPPGFRRARAGTLPSDVHLAAQRFAAASNTLSSTTPSTESFPEQLQQRQNANTPPSLAVPTRPGLRHSTTSVTSAPSASAAVVASERMSRLRSGSLNSPSAGYSNAFGPSIFSSSWLSSANGSSSSFPVLDELRSVTSADSVDDFDVHTLDYLGLDDSHRPPPPPAATLSELRTQAQAAIAGNLANPPRLRASTVSNPYRARSSVAASLLSTPAAEDDEAFFESLESQHLYERQQMGSYDGSIADAGLLHSSYVAKGFKQSDHLAPASALGARPRAISVGTLDDPIRSLQRRATTSEIQPPYLGEPGPTSGGLGAITNPSGILKSDMKLAPRAAAPPNVHFPAGEVGNRAAAYLVAPNSQGRAVSPKTEANSNNSQIQTPTRSLWIGNLDSSVTSEQLIHVFAPYGAIESLRLLPEKECGFVNFVDQADAIRAKDDVLNRLGGNIGMPNGQTVRIGFGKADSAPVAPAKGSTVTSSGATSPNNLGKSSSPGLGGLDAQLQSTPTRALWIGSIPSTTTPATILSVFSPYGPIESARVLTHKNCGFINFERLDDAVRARKALNGRDVLGSDVGAIRIGFAKVPVKNGQEGNGTQDESPSVAVQGIGDLSVGATIHALRSVKGASTVPADQQVLGGQVENYRSNLLLSMIGSGMHNLAYVSDGLSKPAGWTPSVTEQQMIMRELTKGCTDAEADIQALTEFRPPTMYYTTIPLVSERQNNRRWDASKLRELRKRLDSGTMSVEEIDQVVGDFLDGEIVDLASDWLGNTKIEPEASRQIVQALFSSPGDHVLTDVLGDQVNGVAVIHKILTSPFLDPDEKPKYIEATKRVLIELKVIATQAYRRLIEEVGLPIPSYQPTYTTNGPPGKKGPSQHAQGVPGLPSGYPNNDQGLASMMAALQMGGQNPQSGPPQLQIDPSYGQSSTAVRPRPSNPPSAFSPSADPFNPFALRSPDLNSPRSAIRRTNAGPVPAMAPSNPGPFNAQPPSLSQAGNALGIGQAPYNPQGVPQVYQPYAMYQVYQQTPPTNMGAFS
ncbi:hypothetical protein ID866_1883 [Astraeus odoratus]|nr:hypothetical protein ID866_1883 [Astraeus odoratus]